ncbi:MAG TPA: hypothetical protein PKK10_01390 [Woeseiaceae bacterium]|nr:hypothetical protein [Woeseiaceae bacterium]
MKLYANELPVEDARVRAVYRSVATEEVPATLNENILQKARAAARPSDARSLRWFRPLAWAASLVLCVAVVIDTSKIADTAGDRAAALKVTDAPILHDAATMADLRRDPGRDGVTPAALPANPPLESNTHDSATADSFSCSPVEQATPLAWYTCVQRLELRGMMQLAEEQKQALQQAFPDFEPPDAAR